MSGVIYRGDSLRGAVLGGSTMTLIENVQNSIISPPTEIIA